jgi:hypothetical protein
MAPAELARAECDAQRIGSLDTNRPTRATQDIPPSIRRLVWRRDGGKCALPSCRSAAHLELHHIVAREDGGTHDAKNIAMLCDGCHAALHRGQITITGTAPNNLVVTRVHDPMAPWDEARSRDGGRRAASSARLQEHEAAAAVRRRVHVGGDVLDV